MSNNQQQLNNDVFFDFDEEDILVKDEGGEMEEYQENKKTRKQENSGQKIKELEIGNKEIKELEIEKSGDLEIESDELNKPSKQHGKNAVSASFLNKIFGVKKKEDTTSEEEPVPEVGFVWLGEEGQENKTLPTGRQESKKQENKKINIPLPATRQVVKQEIIKEKTAEKKVMTLFPAKSGKSKGKFAQKIKNIQKDLFKKARFQTEKAEILAREGEGLVYNEKDEEEVEKFRRQPLINSYPDVGVLARRLLGQMKIVTALKINLILRLKNIIDAYLRDVRTFAATRATLQRSLESGGLGLPPEQAAQIMEVVQVEYDKMYSAIEVESRKHVPHGIAGSKVESRSIDTISKKTAKDAQVGVFSDEIRSNQEIKKSKKQENKLINKDNRLSSWEERLDIPANLRTPEIEAPEKVEKITSGERETVKTELSKKPTLEKVFKNQEEKPLSPKDVFKIFEKATEDTGGADLSTSTSSLDLNKVESSPVVLEVKEGEEPGKEPKISWWKRKFKKTKKQKNKKTKTIKPIEDVKPTEVSELEVKKEVDKLKAGKKIDKIDKVKEPAKGFAAFKITKPAIQPKQLQAPALKHQPVQQSAKVSPRVFRTKQKDDNRPKIEDVKVVQPRLTGPVEELADMTLADFRRLGPTVADMAAKIREKITLASQDSFNQKIASINAWRKSQPNQLYLKLGRQGLLQRISINDLINQYKTEDKITLTKEEFDAINGLNKELRY